MNEPSCLLDRERIPSHYPITQSFLTILSHNHWESSLTILFHNPLSYNLDLVSSLAILSHNLHYVYSRSHNLKKETFSLTILALTHWTLSELNCHTKLIRQSRHSGCRHKKLKADWGKYFKKAAVTGDLEVLVCWEKSIYIQYSVHIIYIGRSQARESGVKMLSYLMVLRCYKLHQT